MSNIWFRGVAASGEMIEVNSDPYTNTATSTLHVDGVKIAIQAALRYRDGGTTVIETEIGTITFPHKIGNDDRTPRISIKSTPEPSRRILVFPDYDETVLPVGAIQMLQQVDERLLASCALVPKVAFDWEEISSGEVQPIRVLSFGLVRRTQVDTRPMVRLAEKPPLGRVPYLPTHDHQADFPCHALCAVKQWENYVERFGSPYPHIDDVVADWKERPTRKLLRFDYVNHRGEEHNYIIEPVAMIYDSYVPVFEDGTEHNHAEQSWMLMGDVIDRDGVERPGRRTFRMVLIRNLVEATEL